MSTSLKILINEIQHQDFPLVLKLLPQRYPSAKKRWPPWFQKLSNVPPAHEPLSTMIPLLDSPLRFAASGHLVAYRVRQTDWDWDSRYLPNFMKTQLCSHVGQFLFRICLFLCLWFCIWPGSKFNFRLTKAKSWKTYKMSKAGSVLSMSSRWSFN